MKYIHPLILILRSGKVAKCRVGDRPFLKDSSIWSLKEFCSVLNAGQENRCSVVSAVLPSIGYILFAEYCCVCAVGR